MLSSPIVRRFSQAGFDFLCWVVGAAVAVTLRFDLQPQMQQILDALLLGVVMGLFQVVAGWSLQLYRGRYRFGSFDEVIGVVTTTLLVGGATTVALLLVGDGSIPRSAPIIAAGIRHGVDVGGAFRGARLPGEAADHPPG